MLTQAELQFFNRMERGMDAIAAEVANQNKLLKRIAEAIEERNEVARNVG